MHEKSRNETKAQSGIAKRSAPPPALLDGQRGTANGERSLEQAIGTQVRHQRKTSSMTVAELALAAQISPGMLSKIENGQISPSLSTLRTLANALKIPFTLLFASVDQRRGSSFVRAGEGVMVRHRGTGAGQEVHLLGYPLDGSIVAEPYLVTLSKASPPRTQLRAEGVELIYMLNGEIEYMHSNQRFRLCPGDTLLLDSSLPHGFSRLFKTPSSYLSLVLYPRR